MTSQDAGPAGTLDPTGPAHSADTVGMENTPKARMIAAVAQVLQEAGYDCWNAEESTYAATAAVEAVYAFLREAASDGTLFDEQGRFRLDA